jgi:hypothetical protein
MNGTHQFVVHAVGIYLIRDNINRRTQPISEASKDFDLDVNTENTKNIICLDIGMKRNIIT